MTSPPRTPDPPAATAPHAPSATRKIFWPLLAAGLVVCLAWPRAAGALVAALALAGLFRLSARVASREVAWAAVVCAGLYPVFFAEAAHARPAMAAAAFTLWALVLYLPPKTAEAGDAHADDFDAGGGALGRRAACVASFALAGLASGTALAAPLALAAWEVVCRVLVRRRPGAARALCLAPARPFSHTLLLALALAPLAAWLLYRQQRAGYSFINTEYFQFADAEYFGPRVGPTADASAGDAAERAGLLGAVGRRLWQVAAHANLWALTAPAALAMLLPAKADAGRVRRRIDVRVQLVFAVVVLAYVVAAPAVGAALSKLGAAPAAHFAAAARARDVLPAVPPVILVCVSTLRRRLRRWPLAVAAVCAAFIVWIVSGGQ